ncbi:sodium/calcium exchanger regulatory protein 1-like [Ischnura elegans]|uniref:sodium/calcium exchanger regulatory protein 1-like n=1 Tax=Ischnura elegans TaxID=197161 RepID=UPI001ED8785A|nr:sodium/calcium exchanger regulatory protein 1-like [Ischnura elegans]
MDLMCGKFQQESSENLDEFFRAVGMPYLVRLMVCASKPCMEFTKVGDKWTSKTSTLLRTTELSFVEGEEYTEKMQSGVELKNKTEIQGDEMITKSKSPDGQEVSRSFKFSEKDMVMTLTHHSGVQAKRYFKRIEE